MSNPIQKLFSIFLCSFFLFFSSLYSDEPDKIEKNDFEFGFRLGTGRKGRERFDENLKNFRTYDAPNIYTNLSISGFQNLANGEIFFRRRWSPNVKFGFAYGYNQYENFRMTEIASDGYVTVLNFHISTNYFVATYHTEWVFKHVFIEGGLGIGVNQTNWKTTGYAFSNSEFQNQKGYLSGSGMQYKMEGSLNKKITDTLIFQLGIALNFSSVPSFSGSLNGKSNSFFINKEGKVNSINQSDYSDNYLWYNAATRRLDFFVGSAVLYFSCMGRFSI
ncbi:MAG: hypothetical protein L6Q54_03875 [Leptospiraceae bacterium]|nr:hypothetical protein [Leptospiraceae bacterium]MCK6380374.1 hypothetical protein [Leptospiraceae bacterium]NUM41315.1 hypothetical protein [Leptospiraceae bacterium]